MEESIYSCGIPVLVHHGTGLCYWKWSWPIYRQQDEWLTHPIRTRSTVLERKYQREKRSLEIHGKLLKTKKMENSPFEFNCHKHTSKQSKEQAKVSFLLHELLDVLIKITKVVIHRWKAFITTKTKAKGTSPDMHLKNPNYLVHLTQTVHHHKTTRIKLPELILLNLESYSPLQPFRTVSSLNQKKKALLRYQLTHFCIFHHFLFSIPLSAVSVNTSQHPQSLINNQTLVFMALPCQWIGKFDTWLIYFGDLRNCDSWLSAFLSLGTALFITSSELRL